MLSKLPWDGWLSLQQSCYFVFTKLPDVFWNIFWDFFFTKQLKCYKYIQHDGSLAPCVLWLEKELMLKYFVELLQNCLFFLGKISICIRVVQTGINFKICQLLFLNCISPPIWKLVLWFEKGTVKKKEKCPFWDFGLRGNYFPWFAFMFLPEGYGYLRLGLIRKKRCFWVSVKVLFHERHTNSHKGWTLFQLGRDKFWFFSDT